MNYEEEIKNLKTRIEILEKLIISQPTTPVKLDTKRDKTKYMFNGKIHPKNRLVLAVITQFVQTNNPSFEELSSAFDKSLQGSLNVVELLEEASKIKDATKRYFMEKNEQLSLSDGSIVVVCTQWGIFNIPRFIKQANLLGFEITEI
ncbi:MAG: hypothetical protein IKB06_01920 [Clostridia bacterium]|nr:hypothetical protein [Clostridia bacterium]MBR2391228.1 hypothetical protein [Clostridia bacterium]